ncbi:MAG: hypothetical protein VX438_12160, partial [Planctomycetota bacterium]|nr:hypothetical protein [Planctomycetota bacterium]
MKRIQHYATYLKGGAGAAAKAIFDGLHQEGRYTGSRFQDYWELEFLCRSDQELTETNAAHFCPSTSFWGRTIPRRMSRKSFKMAATHYHLHLKDRPKEYECFSPARLYEPTAIGNTKNIGLVHLHWVAFLLDYITFFRSLPVAIPVVWTLHDMNAFTGGCHYSAGCNRYKHGCGNCFQLANPSSDDLSAVTLENKKRALAKTNLT